MTGRDEKRKTAVLRLRGEGKSFGEIAKIMGLSKDTVHGIYHRAQGPATAEHRNALLKLWTDDDLLRLMAMAEPAGGAKPYPWEDIGERFKVPPEIAEAKYREIVADLERAERR